MSLEENTTKSYINFVLQKLHIYHFDIVFFFNFNYFRLFGVENNVWEKHHFIDLPRLETLINIKHEYYMRNSSCHPTSHEILV